MYGYGHESGRNKSGTTGVSRLGLTEVLADSSIELIVNLTPPNAHAEVSCAALEAGKHVYSEKPLATNRGEGAGLLELANRKGLQIACAPDTFLGAGLQTCRRLLAANLPRIEIYGSEGSLSVPDPNTFGGPVRVKSAQEEEWRDVPLIEGYTQNSRGLGVREMAAAIRENRPHRPSGEMAFHVLDLMQSFEESSRLGQHIEVQSRCERPAAL